MFVTTSLVLPDQSDVMEGLSRAGLLTGILDLFAAAGGWLWCRLWSAELAV
jgi:hypothetical protein